MKIVSELFVPLTYRMADGYELNYRLYTPEHMDPARKIPFVLFLHGAGERGRDNLAQLKIGICEPFKREEDPMYDCVVLAPQCPPEEKWVEVNAWTDCCYDADRIPESRALAAAFELTRALTDRPGIDPERIYVTGLSMGGYGTWDLLVRHPGFFAAAQPLCGGADMKKVPALAGVPIRTFHGLQDNVVPPTGTETAVSLLREIGGKIEYIPYPDLKHGIWGRAYAREDFTRWFLERKLNADGTGEMIPGQERSI